MWGGKDRSNKAGDAMTKEEKKKKEEEEEEEEEKRMKRWKRV